MTAQVKVCDGDAICALKFSEHQDRTNQHLRVRYHGFHYVEQDDPIASSPPARERVTIIPLAHSLCQYFRPVSQRTVATTASACNRPDASSAEQPQTLAADE
jgi:hypothetical protein